MGDRDSISPHALFLCLAVTLRGDFPSSLSHVTADGERCGSGSRWDWETPAGSRAIWLGLGGKAGHGTALERTDIAHVVEAAVLVGVDCERRRQERAISSALRTTARRRP